MSHYELTYIISAAIAETEYPTIQKKIADAIKSQFAGTITSESTLGRKKLAYPIKKEKYGHYVTMEFDLEPEHIKALDTELKLNNSLLRHLLLTKKVLTPEQQEHEALVQAKIRAKKSAAKSAAATVEETKKVVKTAKPKINLDKLDEKLDELLDREIK